MQKSIYKTHEQLFDKFPQLKGKLNAVGSTQLGGMTYAQCSFGLGHGGVTVNTKYFSDMEKLAKSYEKTCKRVFIQRVQISVLLLCTNWDTLLMITCHILKWYVGY